MPALTSVVRASRSIERDRGASAPVRQPIASLAEQVVEQIAAGEVIERPASVVRELVDNAVDAGAQRIEVRIEGGGAELIEVVDDGFGIVAAELPLAVQRYATSKLRAVEDLLRVRTMGFRGEGLSSVAAMSRMMIESRAADCEQAARIGVSGGVLEGPAPAARAQGTTVQVRDLFFNAPARREFLKSSATEAAHVSDVVQRAALAHPSVYFSLAHNGRQVCAFSPAKTRHERVQSVVGRRAGSLLHGSVSRPGIISEAVITDVALGGSTSRGLALILNGRSLRDRLLINAALRGYGGDNGPRKYPQGALYLDVDPAQIDINVHPQKQEVRFASPERIFAAVAGAVQQAVGGQREALPTDAPREHARSNSILAVTGAASVPPAKRTYCLSAATDASMADSLRPDGEQPASAAPHLGYLDAKREMREASRRFWSDRRSLAGESHTDYGLDGALARDEAPLAPKTPVKWRHLAESSGGQLVCESDGRLCIVDGTRARQRLARANIERELARGGNLESAEVTPPLALRAPLRIDEGQLSQLAAFGFDLDPFGAESWLLRGVPRVLGLVARKSLGALVEASMRLAEAPAVERNARFAALAQRLGEAPATLSGQQLLDALSAAGIDLERICARVGTLDEPFCGWQMGYGSSR